MLQSMTGFATKSIFLELDKNNKIKLSVSIKSLNSKYFDINSKIPYILSQYETEFIKLIKSQLHRGFIYLNFHISDQKFINASVKPSNTVLDGYIDALNQIKKKYNIEDPITLNEIIRLPDIFIIEDKEIDENSKKIIFGLVNELIDLVIQERSKEGSNLLKDIQERLKLIEQKINQIKENSKKFIDEFKEKISKKVLEINQTFSDVNLAETQRQNLYLQLDKMDINEEIVRFENHLKNINDLINSDSDQKGKQLDFILQELSREINTIAAKSPHSLIVQDVITIKVEIEKIREQVQNIL